MKVTTRAVADVGGQETMQLACTQDVCDSLDVTITPALIENKLGVKAYFRRKSAYYWTADQVEQIRVKLIERLSAL